MRRDCFRAVRRLPGDNNDRTPGRRKRGWPQGALKQAKEKDEKSKEKKVTFVTDKQSEESPTEEEEPVKRKPGRPKGSRTTTKDKPTITTRIFTRSKKS